MQTASAWSDRKVFAGTPVNLVFDLAALGAVGIAGAILVARVDATSLALALLALALGLKLIQYRTAILSVPFQLPWLLFALSGALAVYVSFDPAASLKKFFLIVCGLALFYVTATLKTDLARRLVVWGLIGFAVGTGAYFVTQTDFAQEPTKVGSLTEIGKLLHSLTPQLGWHTPHPNLIAGILMLGLPFGLGFVYEAWKRRGWLTLAASTAASGFLLFCIVMTTSRGAWLALLALGVLVAWFLVAHKAAIGAGLSGGVGIAVALNVLLVGIILLAVFGGARFTEALGSLLGSAGGVSRLDLYRQSAQLAQDFTFTGAGLDTFTQEYSTYSLLIEVPFLPHAHNLWLEIWVEQGALGLVAFVWFMAAYYYWVFTRRERLNWLMAASIIATSLVFLHGIVDVVFYFSRVLPLMFVPIGMTVAAAYERSRAPAPEANLNTPRGGVLPHRTRYAALALVVVMLALVLVALFARRELIIAQLYANLGAVRQSQVEVPLIKFPHPNPPEVRRAADLSRAESAYHAALLHDPTNRVANARLGLIALDRFDFPQAVARLEAAYASDPGNRSVIKELGYAYVFSGRLDIAERLLIKIAEARRELEYTAWLLGNTKPELAALATAMAKRLEP